MQTREAENRWSSATGSSDGRGGPRPNRGGGPGTGGLPAVVGLGLGPPQPERHQNAQGPHPGLHPAVLRGRERRGGEEEPRGREGGRTERAGREKRGRAERRDGGGGGRRLIGEEEKQPGTDRRPK